MSDTTTNPDEDQPLGEINTDFPKLIPDRVYTFCIRSPEIVPTAKDPNNHMLLIKLETTDELKDTEGRPMYAGAKFTTRIGITPSGKRDQLLINKDIGTLAKAVGGDILNLKLSEFKSNPAIVLPLIDGKLVMCKVGMQPPKDGYEEQNSFKFIPQ